LCYFLITSKLYYGTEQNNIDIIFINSQKKNIKSDVN